MSPIHLRISHCTYQQITDCRTICDSLEKICDSLIKGQPSVVSLQNTANFRLVSNVPLILKLLEKATLDQIHQHCVDNHLLPDYQSAYHPGYSYETAISKLVSDLLWGMEYQKVTAMIFLDLSAAFDTMDHDILHDVLHTRFNIHDNCLSWLDSYLSPQWSCVSIGKWYSSDREVHFSVPQGSCMGPTLYTLYASTLKDSVPDSVDIHGYADDHALKEQFDPTIPGSEELVLMDLSNTMISVDHWMKCNCLKLNPAKTEFIYFGSRSHLPNCLQDTILVTDTPVQWTVVTKYLGVLLDQMLSFRQQVVKACCIASLNLTRIHHIRKYLMEEACATLVKTLVLSHLDYCNVMYIGLPDKDVQKLQ